MKLIATLTTLPSRIAFIEPVLVSILSQSLPPDEVHLQVPAHSLKEDCTYKLPDFLFNHQKVRVVEQDTDYGPATKWLTPLDYLHGQEALLLIMDDDCHYPPNMVAQLYRQYEKNPVRVYCSTGGVLTGKEIRQYKVAEQPQKNALTVLTENQEMMPVDTVQGFSLVLFSVDLIPAALINQLKQVELAQLADDIVLSGMFEKADVQRMQIAPYQVPQPLEHAEINPIHGEGRLTNMSMKAFNWVQQELSVWGDYKFVENWKPSFADRFQMRLQAFVRRRFGIGFR